MNKVSDKIWYVVVILCAIALTIYTLTDVATQPWHAMPGIGSDGVRSEFSYLYQGIYGKWFWFHGMNYPYGEHVVYADGQTFYFLILSCFPHVTVGGALTLIWWFISLSYVVSIVYLYKILTHFGMARPAAVLFACLIGIFTPQIHRVLGHFGLSCICVIPMLFYWTIRFHEQSRKRYCAYIFIMGLIATLLHPYFSAMILLWSLAYVLGYFIFIKAPAIQKIRHVWPLPAAAAMIFVVVGIMLHFTDPVKDRPVMPYGLLAYNTHFNDIFTSPLSPIWVYVRDHHMLRDIFPYISEAGEGFTYVGVTVTVALIISLFVFIARRAKKLPVSPTATSGRFSRMWLFMALAALLFGMAVPYIWHMEWLIDYMSYMRQFRSLGRFSWLFYYIATIYGALLIYDCVMWLKARGFPLAGYTLLTLSALLWGYEAYYSVSNVRNTTLEAGKNYDFFFSTSEPGWNNFMQSKNLKNSDFQAMLALPFFHIGSDKLWVGNVGMNLTLACQASFQLHIPLIDQYMARASWGQTKKQVKIVAGPYVDKPILHEINSNKPLLLLTYDMDSLNADDKYLLQAADYIGHFSRCNVYAFYPQRQIMNDKINADSIDRILPFIHQRDSCVINNGSWYVNHFDNDHAASFIFGSGAQAEKSRTDSVIAVIPVQPIVNGQEFEFSAWFLLSSNDYRSPIVLLESLDSAGNSIGLTSMDTKYSVDNHDMWFRGFANIRVNGNCRSIKCRLVNPQSPGYEIMDELMLRPTGSLIISKAADGSVMVNNHLFKKANNDK